MNIGPSLKDQEELLLSIKAMASGFFTGSDKSARAAGAVLIAIESKVTDQLIKLHEASAAGQGKR